ncbi:uncharacterized protein LOC131034227 [Cryptomeria japonica]|uniref:uncharacterized protein LOC131034227 n=1 Tax=Cryptomeria japonica TaxID=3369 RepID=UPI0025AC135F|nr:uncharacterized protein LOC131034227 [Cryptomeria japonica]
MEFDYRKGGSNRGQMGGGGGAAPYDVSRPMYKQPYGVSPYAQAPNSYYPTVGQSSGPPISRPPPPVPVSSSTSSLSSGTGIRVAIKPEYRITPPPQLSPQLGEIPRSTFQFDFDFERKILAEAEKGSQNWNRIALESPSRQKSEPNSLGSVDDQIINKYVAMGLNREAVSLAVTSFGDDQNKVREFVTSYSLLREMGFPSHTVAGVLAMYDNDRDKALAHFLSNPS